MTKKKRFPLPLRYPGGKYYAIDILRPFFDGIEHQEYREPFAGGATIFFNKEKSQINWLNDIDDELITLYQTIQCPSKRKKLAEKFENQPEATKEKWREVFETIPKTPFEVAYKYYFLNRTSFSGKLVSAAWGYRPKRSLPPRRWKERIIPAGEKLENTLLTSQDFSCVIKHPAKSKHQVLMYVDPPYFKPPKHKHYRYGLDVFDHERLAILLSKTEHKFFLTYDDCKEIREMYKWANIFELQFFYRVQNSNSTSGNRKIGFELIISNFTPKESNKNLQYELPI